MNYQKVENSVVLTDFNHFSIDQILECGQCFRFEKLDDMHYSLIAFGRILYVLQTPESVKFYYNDNTLDLAEFKNIWMPYFDLHRDYGAIITKIASGDAVMRRAVDYAPGIRILQQDPWEMLISFIISANNRIPQIKQVIKNIATQYGTRIDAQNHAFPTINQLLSASADELRMLKTGFRDKYIVGATQKAAAGALDLSRNTPQPTEELRKSLLMVNGIGEKVAHCILLFGYGRMDSFPVDTWVRKVMQQYYFDGSAASAEQIQALAKDRFGELSGFAQQYLFHYIRTAL